MDLAQLRGSGPSGRILKARRGVRSSGTGRGRRCAVPDTHAAVGARGRRRCSRGTTARHSPTTICHTTSARRVIAGRLAEAKRTIPHFYLTVDCDVDALPGGPAAGQSVGAGLAALGQRLHGQGRGTGVAQGAGGERSLDRRRDPTLPRRRTSRSPLARRAG